MPINTMHRVFCDKKCRAFFFAYRNEKSGAFFLRPNPEGLKILAVGQGAQRVAPTGRGSIVDLPKVEWNGLASQSV